MSITHSYSHLMFDTSVSLKTNCLTLHKSLKYSKCHFFYPHDSSCVPTKLTLLQKKNYQAQNFGSEILLPMTRPRSIYGYIPNHSFSFFGFNQNIHYSQNQNIHWIKTIFYFEEKNIKLRIMIQHFNKVFTFQPIATLSEQI